MRKSTLTLSVAGAAIIALTGGVAVANQHGGDRGAPMTLAQTKTHSAQMFERMDANNDGVINAADRAAKRAERFAATDTNNDGELTKAEMTAAREARKAEKQERRMERRESRMEQRFERLDTDNSGGVSQAEMDAAQQARAERRGEARSERRGGGDRMGMHRGGKGMKGGGKGMGRMMLRMADANNDQQVTRAEFDTAVETHFAQMDADNDGTVTADERKAARKAMRDTMREKRGERGGMRGQ